MTAAFDRVARWAAGLLAPDEDAATERDLFTDPALRAAAADLDDLTTAIREVASAGGVVPVLTLAQLAGLRATGVPIVEVASVGGRADAVLGPDVALVCARIPIDLAGVRAIDVEICDPAGRPYFRTHEAPFDPADGAVVVLCKRHVALAAGDIVVRIVDDRARELGRHLLSSRAT